MPKQKTQKQPLTIEDFKAKQEREMFLQEMNMKMQITTQKRPTREDAINAVYQALTYVRAAMEVLDKVFKAENEYHIYQQIGKNIKDKSVSS